MAEVVQGIKTHGLTQQDLADMYFYMLLARRFDERLWLLNRAGKIPFVVSGQGQEALQVAAGWALDSTRDYLFPYYRDSALVMTFGMTIRDLMLQNFAKAEDPNSGGRQMPGHYGGKKYRIVTGSSPVATQIPHAAGMALAARMKGDPAVCFVTFGEGSSNQGDFHEGLNFAGVHQLPVVFMCENNQYAISVPLEKQVAGGSVAKRADGYGMPGVQVDGNDPIEVYRVCKEAIDRARAGNGPTLIETITYRYTPHSSDDDDLTYRSAEEVKAARQEDCVEVFKQRLIDAGVLREEDVQKMEEDIRHTIDQATDDAERAPYAEGAHALNHVYAE